MRNKRENGKKKEKKEEKAKFIEEKCEINIYVRRLVFLKWCIYIYLLTAKP